MIKITNMYLIGLVSASLLVGCGGDSEANEGNEANEATEHTGDGNQPVEDNNGNGAGDADPETPPTDTPTPTPTVNASTFAADVMPVLTATCQSCHGSNGRFTITTADGTYANISDLADSVTMAGQYLLDKGSNTVNHGGGAVLSTSSSEYATIKSWVDAGADLN